MALSVDDHRVIVQMPARRIQELQLATVQQMIADRQGGTFSWMLILIRDQLLNDLQKPKRRRIRIDGITQD